MKQLLALTAGIVPGLCFAHGDHGASFMEAVHHVFSDSVHLLPIVALVLLGITFRRPVAKAIKARFHKQ